MTFWRNIGLFFVLFLPAVALVSMVLTGVLGESVQTSPDWDIGWNPILWLIMTAPWLLPTILAVPLLHLLGKGVAKGFSRPLARRILLGASPVLFMVCVLIEWGPDNFTLEFVLPVAVSGLLYGGLLRIPRGAE